jgi:hypothetical protein
MRGVKPEWLEQMRRRAMIRDCVGDMILDLFLVIVSLESELKILRETVLGMLEGLADKTGEQNERIGDNQAQAIDGGCFEDADCPPFWGPDGVQREPTPGSPEAEAGP